MVFHCFIPRIRNLIVVSSLLERRFEGRGRHMMRIASPLDVRNTPCVDRTPPDRLILVYAGMAGKKDLLVQFLYALAELTTSERRRVEFRLLGPSRDDLLTLLGSSAGLLEQLDGTVKPMGRIPRNQVIEALQEAHFSVLLRPDLQYANAGFPSKVTESLSVGTPVLLNFTSDLAHYLKDEKAALRIMDCSVEEVTKTIRRALSLSPEELKRLRFGARMTAEQNFDYRLYLDSFATYLGQLQ